MCADVCAHPSSVNVLSAGEGAGALDARTPDKLIDGMNARRSDAAHSWLAPVLPDTLNRCVTNYTLLQTIVKLQ